MGEAERKLEHLARSAGAVAYAYEFHFLAVAGGHAYNHVVDQRAVETVLGAVFAVVGGTDDVDVAVLYLYFEFRVDCLREFAFGAFNGDDVVGVDFHCYACGNLDGGFTYS